MRVVRPSLLFRKLAFQAPIKSLKYGTGIKRVVTLIRTQQSFATEAPSSPSPTKPKNESSADAVIQKYKSKLEKAAQSRGMTNIQDLLKSVQAESNIPKREVTHDSSDVKGILTKKGGAKDVSSQKNNHGSTSAEVKSLNDIMKVELLEPLDAKTIGLLWNQHFSGKPGLSASLSMGFYSTLKAFSKKYPFFILPLPRESGYEFYFLQFSGDQVYFTSLLEYQTHGSFAKPLLILTHYTELGESKDLVLLRGELGDPSNDSILSPAHAQNLVYQLQLFYVTGGPEKQALVESFHRNPAVFDYKCLIEGLEKLP